MNIRVDLNTPIRDGMDVLFRSPVDCSQVTGLTVYYNGESKEFAFADAHGNNVGDIDHLFAENVVVKVILDLSTSMAFVQNADTNAYLEGRFQELEDKIGKGTVSDHSAYFDIDVDGLISLKPEYRGAAAKNDYPHAVSNNGVGVEGDNANELPEVLVIPDVINDIAISALCEGMFSYNTRVKSITLPVGVTTIPKGFANQAINLTEVNGTENIEVIGQAAFQKCGIKKAMFPNLKTFNGVAQFNMSPNLTAADIGNTVTNITQNCFADCESLSSLIGGGSVTNIGPKAFYNTRSLKYVPFLRQVTFIDYEAFIMSSVSGDGSHDFDWWDFKENSGCKFGTKKNKAGQLICNATPAHFNETKWWNDCVLPTKSVINALGSTFHQKNPECSSLNLPNSVDTYLSGCLEISTAHAYSALTGDELISTAECWKSIGIYPGIISPRVFIEYIVAKAKAPDGGSLLTPSYYNESKKGYVYVTEDMEKWLEALGLDCEILPGTSGSAYTKENLNRLYEDVSNGAVALISYYYTSNGETYGHEVVVYGVAENGDVFVLDSDTKNYTLQDYTARTFRVPLMSFAKTGTIMIVKKRNEEV